MRLAVLFALLAVLVAPSAARADELSCTGDPSQAARYDMTVAGQPTYGRFAAPAAPPTALVVLAHGYSYTAEAYRGHVTRTALATGALVVAPTYRGTSPRPFDGNMWGVERSRGWPVRTGSEDVVAVAQLALARCPTVRTVVLYGFSMGGNVSGIALASKPKRPDGRPLFDFWVAVEGVHNLTELYEGARALAPFNAFAKQAEEDIRAETGGTPETAPAAYRERTNVLRVQDIAAAGLRGVAVVHAREDGEAVYNQALELVAGLRDGGVPTDLFTVGSRAPGDDPDTTIVGYTGVRTGQAGHAEDPSARHIVPVTGYDRISALLVRGEPDPCDREFAVEGRDRSVSPDPAQPSPGCPPGEVRSRPAASGGGGDTRPALCAAPASVRAISVRRRGRGLVVTGRARRSRCAGAGPVRAEVAVVRREARGRCRPVWRSGRLGRRVACAGVPFRRARGRSPWSLRLARVPARGVTVHVRARDARGAGPVRVVRVRGRR